MKKNSTRTGLVTLFKAGSFSKKMAWMVSFVWGSLLFSLTSIGQTFAEVASGTHPMTGIGATLAATSNSFIVADLEGNDGDLDLVGRNVTNNGLVFWRHNGNSTNWTQLTGAANPFNSITYATASASNFTTTFIAVLDADGDGDLDIYNKGTNELYRNNGGTFTAVTGAANPMDAIAASLAAGAGSFLTGDFDGDGDKDLVGRNAANNGLVFWRNNGGTWVSVSGAANPFNSIVIGGAADFTFTNLALVDADGNGSIDIYNKKTAGAVLYRNNGASYSEQSGASNPMDAIGATLTANSAAFITADLDSDGDLDLLGRNTTNNALVYWQKGTGNTWTQLTGANNPFNVIVLAAAADFSQATVAALDVEKDGDVDVFNNGKSSVYIQSGVAPVLVSFVPVLNATDVNPTTNITLTFNEAVKLSTTGLAGTGSLTGTGDITIKKVSDNSLVERINTVANAGRITGTGTATLIVNPVGDLPAGTELYVQIGANAILSNANNVVYQGISQNNIIRFTTAALPEITSQPSNVTSCSGKSVSFTVVTSGTITSRKWQVSNNAAFTSPTDLTNTGVYSGTNTNTLMIAENSALNGRFYRFIATNLAGNATSDIVSLTVTPSSLPTGFFQLTQNVSNPVFQDGSCLLGARIIPSGGSPVSGNVTLKSWNRTNAQVFNNQVYARRNYEITPASNATTATARVTLFFTQADFDNYNSINVGPDLPANPGDNAGKANLKVSKLDGSSSDNSGNPATYAGTGSLIDPVDTDIVWNDTLMVWQISFNVTGFSGLFIQTRDFVLPLQLVSFKAKGLASNRTELSWQVVGQDRTARYDVERSSDNNGFTKISSLEGNGQRDAAYVYLDQVPSGKIWYYRLRMTDSDGSVSFSKVVAVNLSQSETVVEIFPNPVRGKLMIRSFNLPAQIGVRLVNGTGSVLSRFILSGATHEINMSGYPAGLYQLVFDDGKVLKVIKQ